MNYSRFIINNETVVAELRKLEGERGKAQAKKERLLSAPSSLTEQLNSLLADGDFEYNDDLAKVGLLLLTFEALSHSFRPADGVWTTPITDIFLKSLHPRQILCSI